MATTNTIETTKVETAVETITEKAPVANVIDAKPVADLSEAKAAESKPATKVTTAKPAAKSAKAKPAKATKAKPVAKATKAKSITKVTKKVKAKAPSKKSSAKLAAKTQKARVSKAKKEVIEAVDAVEDAVEATSKSIFARLSANVTRAQGVAKQVWFANLGVAGRTYEEAVSLYEKAGDELQNRYSKLNRERQGLVEDLVSRGEKVQDEAEARLKESRVSVEEQIEVAKDRMLGFSSVIDIPSRLQDLSDKLESLSKDLKKSA